MLGDDYNPLATDNGPWFVFRQGIDNPDGTAFTKGVVDLVIFPGGEYSVRAVTSGFPGGTIATLVNKQPIGPAFASADTDGDGILESNEPFTALLACSTESGAPSRAPTLVPRGRAGADGFLPRVGALPLRRRDRHPGLDAARALARRGDRDCSARPRRPHLIGGARRARREPVGSHSCRRSAEVLD